MESQHVPKAHRVYYEEEIEGMIRQMKIEGGSLEDCTRELHLLANFVSCPGGRACGGMAEATERYGL
jgi:hypothetical protein